MSTKLPRIPGIDTEEQLKEYHRIIVQCLIKYGGLDEQEAQRRIEESRLLSELDTEYDLMYLFHEEPYYWAMDILHSAGNPQWYRDPKLWPPPEDYYDRVSSHPLGTCSGVAED